MSQLKKPIPVLQPGKIYMGDNGRLMCMHCAGFTALLTGYDLSGQKLHTCNDQDAREWDDHSGETMTCECERTIYTYTPPCPKTPT